MLVNTDKILISDLAVNIFESHPYPLLAKTDSEINVIVPPGDK